MTQKQFEGQFARLERKIEESNRRCAINVRSGCRSDKPKRAQHWRRYKRHSREHNINLDRISDFVDAHDPAVRVIVTIRTVNQPDTAQEKEDQRANFEMLYGAGNCSCHINPPCDCCTHPGNPINNEY